MPSGRAGPGPLNRRRRTGLRRHSRNGSRIFRRRFRLSVLPLCRPLHHVFQALNSPSTASRVRQDLMLRNDVV